MPTKPRNRNKDNFDKLVKEARAKIVEILGSDVMLTKEMSLQVNKLSLLGAEASLQEDRSLETRVAQQWDVLKELARVQSNVVVTNTASEFLNWLLRRAIVILVSSS